MAETPPSKVTSLAEAIAAIPDGSSIAIGGNTVHRSPSAAVHEIVRQGKRDLTAIKTAGAYDIDLLCGAGCVSRLLVAYVGFENLHGMAMQFRRAVEQGRVSLSEQTCPTVITGLRAAAQGIPFMPIAGMWGSDLLARQFRTVPNPYGDGDVVTVPALWPDWAIIHVQEADEQGNARIHGTRFEDVLMAQAARKVLITCERLVDGTDFERTPELTAIPGFQVNAVVHLPRGAWPASCTGYYGVDEAYVKDYYAISSSAGPEELRRFVAERTSTAAPAAAVP